MRPVLYDLTRLVTRLLNRTPNGIDRVDYAYARHFLHADFPTFGFVGTPLGGRLFNVDISRALLELLLGHWREDSLSENVEEAEAFLRGAPHGGRPRRVSISRGDRVARIFGAIWKHGIPWGASAARDFTRNGLYLNISQYPLNWSRWFRWLEDRPDIDAVFFIHDLLPLQMPEYFRPVEYQRHLDRLSTLAARGCGALVSSATVRDDLASHLAARSCVDLPICVAPLCVDARFRTTRAKLDPEKLPYFLMCGTLEPRKNHLLILQIWRTLAQRLGANTPKLVLVGERGWENEHILDLLERCPELHPHVIELSGLPTPYLAKLMAGACALLMPSFGEGYGLPVAEALAEGVPVIASDIPQFRDLAGGLAELIDPIDAVAWRSVLLEFAEPGSARRAAWIERLQNYAAPDWPSTFETVEKFLVEMPSRFRPPSRGARPRFPGSFFSPRELSLTQPRHPVSP